MTSTDSATLDSVTPPATSARRNSYGRLWGAVPRELGFLLLGFPLALAGFVVTVTLFSAGTGTLVIFVGFFVIIATLYASRGFGLLELRRLEWAGRPPIERPGWQDARARNGFWGWLRSLFGNGHYWLYLLHTGFVGFVISTVTWTIIVTWLSVAFGGLSYWFWQLFSPHQDQEWHISTWLLRYYGSDQRGADGRDILVYLVIGIVFTLTLPFVTRGLVMLHWGAARGMLGAFRSDALQREVIAMGASRTAAAAAEGTALRRLERDIHDGPQQRLVRLQMDLAAADRQLDNDPGRARALLGEAMEQSREALDELRALSRGFAPPLLLDRGLIAALESLADRNRITLRMEGGLDAGAELPQEIERNAYFVASELLTNVTKHSAATGVGLRVALRRIPEPDATWLDVVVTDNGSGGARLVGGHGLAGLEERMRGLGGTLEIDSPAGGPTTVTAHLPVTY
ncbi:MAG TPA: sensor domain-containing protein [Lacisediminihabitans sp.]|uniref:sensor histidine kinase n=1 Tax=Lacisediminihabitans sp. TaxID=2787631 RepID=UPI002ED9D01B